MYQDMKVNFGIFSIKYPSYIKLQATIVIALLISSILCFLFAQDSQIWLLKNGHWLYPVIALLEVGESFIAIKKSKKDFNTQMSAETT